jgi:hypothetical protein
VVTDDTRAVTVATPRSDANDTTSSSTAPRAPEVNRYLSAEQINLVVRNNQAAIRQCYQEGVRHQADLQGRVELAWRISLEGVVTECRVGEIRSWRFPRPDGGEVSVDYPFIFGQRR